MNVFHIKLIAVAGMVVSHVGIFFFPHYPLLRIIGTIAFPLFAWLIANGARHTTDIQKYLARLFIFALLSQVPFALANGMIDVPLHYLNVFFTLFLGLLAIAVIQRNHNVAIQAVSVILCAALAQYLNTDYGAAGVLSIVAFYVFSERMMLMILSQIVILGVLPLVSYFGSIWLVPGLWKLYAYYPHQGFSTISLLIIAFYNHEKGPSMQFWFYAFYPLHFLVIAIILQMLSRV